jgi:hypothetical protein
VTSEEALANPLHQDVSLSYPVFSAPELTGVLVDSHFSDRSREGRLLAFLARFLKEKARAEVVGLGLDEGAAVAIQSGAFRIHAPAGQAAWLYRVTGPARVEQGTPLELSGIRRARLNDGSEGAWPVDFGSLSTVELRVQAGVIEIVR